MPRVRKGAARARKHKKILKSTRGYIGAASRRYRVAIEAWMRAGRYATEGRKLKKRDFRRLWITRISAACRQRGATYSHFMHGLSETGVTLNRKMLAEIAVADAGAFDKLVAAAAEAPAEPLAPDKTKKAEAPAPAEAEKPKKAPPAKKAPVAKRAAAKAKKSEQQPEAAAKAPKKAAPAKKKTAAKAKAKAPKGKPAATRTRKKASTKKPKSREAPEQ